MQKGINKVILIGNAGKDPEVHYMPSGMAVTNLSLATSEEWRDKQTGEKKEKTEWHKVVFMGKLAEIVGEFVRKGSQIYVEGKLQTRKWQDQGGVERYTTEVLVDGFTGVMQMLGGRQQGQGAQHEQQPSSMQHHNQQRQPQSNQMGQGHHGAQGSSNQHPGARGTQRNAYQEASGGSMHGNQQMRSQQRSPTMTDPGYNHPQGEGGRPIYNEPPMDFDDDIPF